MGFRVPSGRCKRAMSFGRLTKWRESVRVDKELYERGLQVRREVLGDLYVDRAAAGGDEFAKPIQDLVNEYCWGWLWTREGLPRQTRSLINIAMLSVLNRPRELKVHVAGALRNGCSKAQIQEALLQATIYGGVPCGVDSFRAAREALHEYEAETAPPA
jgi:4-carboxymuconolactone decarboxylase